MTRSDTTCISSHRLKAIFHGKSNWTPVEESHLHECHYCFHDATQGVEECFSTERILDFSLGAKPTKQEREHMQSCPQCADDFEWVVKKIGTRKGKKLRR
jgi:hypothetical protein